MMNRQQLIDAILDEMDRVWGDAFEGTDEQYRWLQTHYGISDMEDVTWQLVLAHDEDELTDQDLEDEELMDFLEDNFGVVLFLEELLRKYRAGTQVYRR